MVSSRRCLALLAGGGILQHAQRLRPAAGDEGSRGRARDRLALSGQRRPFPRRRVRDVDRVS